MKTIKIALFIVMIAVKPAFSQQLDIEKLRSDSSVAGAQIIWIDKNKTTTYNTGSAFTGVDQKVNSNTIFQAASLSKVVLAYICMKLVAEKKINLDTPLYTYLDYQRMKNDPDAKKITARMVLNHTTGWPNWVEGPSLKTWPTSVLKTQFEPGTKWSYSGEGFAFLQFVIQSILKKDFQSIATEMVFKPLGMKNSSFVWEKRFEEYATFGYNNKNEAIRRSQFASPNAAYSLLTTATDYSLFLKALRKRELKFILMDEVSTSKGKESKIANDVFWGLGIGIQHNELGKTAWHWGDNGNYKTFFIIHPEKKQMLICFTNSVNGLKLMEPLANHYFGKANWSAVEWLRHQ